MLGQARHGHDVAGERHHEAGAGSDLDVPHRDTEALGRAQALGVVGEGVLGLGHADGQVGEALLLDLGHLLLRGRGEVNAVGVVDATRDGLDAARDTGRLVGIGELARLVAEAHDLLGQRQAALAALGPDLGKRHVDAELVAPGLDERELGGGIGREGVDGHHHGQAEDLAHVGDVAQQVGHAGLEGLEVLGAEVGLGDTAVVLEGAHRRHDHAGVGLKAGHAALDVAELLGTEVGAEARLGHYVVAQLHGRLGGHDGVAAMGDVGEGAAVDEGRRVLERLHEVGRDGVLEKGRHGTLGVQVVRRDGTLVVGVAHHDAAQALLEVGDGGGQAEHGHDLGGHRDVEAVLARHAVGHAAHAAHDVAQLAVVHVNDALPCDAARVDAKLVALLDVVVEHGGEQVVRRTDGVEVSGEVQVDVLHRHHLGVAAAGGAALDAKDGAEARLAQGEHGVLAHAVEGVGQAHRGGGLALAGRRGVDGGHEDELGAARLVGDLGDVDLGHVVAVRHELVVGEAQALGHALDGPDLGLLGNLDIRHGHGAILSARWSGRAA